MRFPTFRSFSHPLLALLFCMLLAGTFALTPMGDFDVWWHLHVGRWILAHRTIPHVDLFSLAGMGGPWINHEWLAQVLAYFFYLAGGISGLIFYKTVVVFVVFWLLVRLCQQGSEKNPWLWLVFVLVAWVASPRFTERPHLLSLLLAVVFLVVLESRRLQGRVGPPWWLLVMQVLWANTHGMAILGAWMGTLYTLESLRSPARKGWWAWGLGLWVALLVTPYGWQGFIFPWQHLARRDILATTPEWLSPFSPQLPWLLIDKLGYFILLIVGLFFLWRARPRRIVPYGLFISLAFLAGSSHRWVDLFVILTVPTILLAVPVASSPGPGSKRYFLSWLVAILALVFFHGVGVPQLLGSPAPFFPGGGVLRAYDFRGAMQWLDAHDVTGRFYNSMELGGWINFYRQGKIAILVDGRTPIYSQEFLARYRASWHDPGVFKQLDHDYHFQGVALSQMDRQFFARQLADYLESSPMWQKVYGDGQASIFLEVP